VGATLKLWGGASDSGCCSVADVDDARRVAQMLGIDHHVFNYTEEFERHVVAPFVEAYAAGQSPNPCIECNRHIKFDLLFDRARRLGLTPSRPVTTLKSWAATVSTISFAVPMTTRTRATCSATSARTNSPHCSSPSAP